MACNDLFLKNTASLGVRNAHFSAAHNISLSVSDLGKNYKQSGKEEAISSYPLSVCFYFFEQDTRPFQILFSSCKMGVIAPWKWSDSCEGKCMIGCVIREQWRTIWT